MSYQLSKGTAKNGLRRLGKVILNHETYCLTYITTCFWNNHWWRRHACPGSDPKWILSMWIRARCLFAEEQIFAKFICFKGYLLFVWEWTQKHGELCEVVKQRAVWQKHLHHSCTWLSSELPNAIIKIVIPLKMEEYANHNHLPWLDRDQPHIKDNDKTGFVLS